MKPYIFAVFGVTLVAFMCAINHETDRIASRMTAQNQSRGVQTLQNDQMYQMNANSLEWAILSQ